MYLFLFLSLDKSSVWCVLAIWWAGSHCVRATFGTFLSGVFRWCPFVCMWVAEGHTARLRWLCVCVVCSSPRGVGVARRRACPHRRDVGALVHSACQWWGDPLGHNGLARLCVFGNRGRRTHNGYPIGQGRVGDEGYDSLAFLGACVSLRCWAFATGGLVQHGDTPSDP